MVTSTSSVPNYPENDYHGCGVNIKHLLCMEGFPESGVDQLNVGRVMMALIQAFVTATGDAPIHFWMFMINHSPWPKHHL